MSLYYCTLALDVDLRHTSYWTSNVQAQDSFNCVPLRCAGSALGKNLQDVISLTMVALLNYFIG